jgi:hypothetical protein
MYKVHKPITTQYYTPSSKPFRIYLDLCSFSFEICGVCFLEIWQARATVADCLARGSNIV